MLYLSLLFTANVAATDAGVAATNAASAASAVSTAAHIHPAAAASTANAATTAIVVASASLLFLLLFAHLFCSPCHGAFKGVDERRLWEYGQAICFYMQSFSIT